MVQTPDGAVRALFRRQTLLRNFSNQMALAKAGSVPLIIMWLSGGLKVEERKTLAAQRSALALSMATPAGAQNRTVSWHLR